MYRSITYPNRDVVLHFLMVGLLWTHRRRDRCYWREQLPQWAWWQRARCEWGRQQEEGDWRWGRTPQYPESGRTPRFPQGACDVGQHQTPWKSPTPQHRPVFSCQIWSWDHALLKAAGSHNCVRMNTLETWFNSTLHAQCMLKSLNTSAYPCPCSVHWSTRDQ